MHNFFVIICSLFLSLPCFALGGQSAKVLEPLNLVHPLTLLAQSAQDNDEPVTGASGDLDDVQDDDEPVNDSADSDSDATTEQEDEELLTSNQKRKLKGFWGKYFAFQMNPHLSKEVDDNLWVFFVGGGCFGCVGGPVWLPMLVIDQQAPKSYLEDGLINWGLHFLVERALDAPMILLAAMTGATIPNPLTCVDAWWWMPVNAINIWDDARKNQSAKLLMEQDWAVRLASQAPAASPMAY